MRLNVSTPRTPGALLVIRLGALGDLVLARNVFHALRVQHAQDRIVLLTRPQFVALTTRMPWFDEIWADPGVKPWQVGRWLAFRQRLRKARFSRVYDLQCNTRSGWYFRLMHPHPPEWVGAVRGCSHRRPAGAGARLPAEEIWFRLIGTAGVPRAGEADMNWLDGPLDALDLPPRFVVVVPGCSAHRPQKRWPALSYGQLALQLQARGIAVVAVGTEADREAIQTLCAQAPAVINLAGRTDFGQLAALGRRAAAVIGNDTGPIHIFAAVGAPTLVLYSGESDPVVVRPNGPRVAWLQRERLADLSVAEVWSELSRHWLQDIAENRSPEPT